MAIVHDDLLVFRSCAPGSPGGQTMTLARRVLELLVNVENRFGPRDRSSTFLGVEFCEQGPRTWLFEEHRSALIQLSISAMNDVIRSAYQLAHECVHLLDPVRPPVSVMEEGVAALFSLEYAQHLQPSYSSSSPKYDAAGLLADRLLSRNPNSIKQLRGGGARLASITPRQLTQVCPELDLMTIEMLCTNFDAWDGVVSL
jgi:hypothetical protein